MMYLLVIGLTMFVLPLGSIWLEFDVTQSNLLWLTGKWFVFWAVGVRLMLAGLRQYLQPAFTSRDILGIESPAASVLVRELGGANIASGIVGIGSILMPTFVLPSAISAGLFYAVAAMEHVRSTHRGANENIALVSDIYIAIILICFTVAALFHGLR